MKIFNSLKYRFVLLMSVVYMIYHLVHFFKLLFLLNLVIQ